jgi:isoleucyl-tRNA synthetase
MSLKYPEFSGLNLPAIEQEILSKWSKGEAFEKAFPCVKVKSHSCFMKVRPAPMVCPAFTM